MPDLTRGYTFTSGEEVDHTKLNNLTGNATINDLMVTESKIAASAVTNAKVSSTAAIALSKLASGSSGQVVVGNSSGVPVYTAMSGDVTINDTGVTAIGAGKVVTASVLDANITTAKIANDNVTDAKILSKKTVSTSAPSGGSDGDVWYKVAS